MRKKSKRIKKNENKQDNNELIAKKYQIISINRKQNENQMDGTYII
jgi:hypothetical protein